MDRSLERDFASERARLVRSLRPRLRDERVLAALGKVPRECFVSPDLWPHAYDDAALPIGYGQAISQPQIVVLMLHELGLQGDEKVLDVGAGSGYQTALLAEMAREVIGVELIPGLAERATSTLTSLGYSNARIEVAGEELGWPAEAPYDAIVVGAAAPKVPQSLIDQLAPGGRLVIPTGSLEAQQIVVVKGGPGGRTEERKAACRFVPLIGRESFGAATGDGA